MHTFNQLQAQLEEVKQTKDSARKLELENRQLSERLNKLSADGKTIINLLKAQVRRLEQGKESLQNEVQIAKTEVCTYNLCLIFLLSVIYATYLSWPINTHEHDVPYH